LINSLKDVHMIDIPLGLRQALESGDCVLFIGAGIGEHLIDGDGSPAPNAAMLAEELVDRFSIATDDVSNLAKIATVVELRKGRAELEGYLSERLAALEPDDKLRWLFTLRWRAIYTTNYDNGIKRAYELNANPPQNPIILSATSDLIAHDPRFEVPIIHLHGALFGIRKPNIIITEGDYARFREQRRMLFELLKYHFATSNILYIGYGNRDPNWSLVLSELSAEFGSSPLPPSYRIAPKTDSLEAEILASKGITTIDASYQAFGESAALILAESTFDADDLLRIKGAIPLDIVPQFEKNPAPVARLMSSWIYVNQAPFSERSNLSAFLSGDRPNWGLISSGQIFTRDLEEEIYTELLDYATSDLKSPSVLTVLGSAGYGVSTLLMILAARLVKEGAGKVFMHRHGNPFLEGDIEFALSLFSERSFIFIDNAADYSEKLNTLITRLRETRRNAIFILGERINEWKQTYKKPRGTEYQFEPLSDPEIYRLLEYLEKHSILNALEPFTQDRRFSVIKNIHKKELLIVMREATEGRSFDAIIEDEFRGISEPLARRLYSIVCCFYQHGVYIRNELLSQLLGVSITDLYDQTERSTEGVIVYECINQAKELYAARARHRTIAAIVWERCVNLAEQEQVIQSSLRALNLNYGIDKDAFERFYMSDRLVDSISTLDGRIRFFDTACSKDPTSPYVRQHYARMLLREHKTELALLEIDKGIELDPSAKILLHTKGKILMEMAIHAESPEIARRRVLQSESCFKAALATNKRDNYNYQGLAELYLGWAKRAESEAEAMDYVTKAEETVSEGLRNVPVTDRESLWIESSHIQGWLKDEPSRLRALETAVKENPGSIYARYILARIYRKSARFEDAVSILEPVIRGYPEEFRVYVEYALALAHLQKSYREAISLLRLSTLYGYSDQRFIATLAGMEFMSKNFKEAQKVFEEAVKHRLSYNDITRVEFKPINFENVSEPLRFVGKVVLVKAQYALIESAGFPTFLCPGSKFGGLLLEHHLNVSFEPAFCAKGPIADKPKLLV
jgi:predicted Zn-dependent protease